MTFDPDRRKVLSAAGAATLAATLPVPSLAQSLPSGPVRMIVGYPAGGGTDVMGRLIAEKLKERLGINVLVENRAGGLRRSHRLPQRSPASTAVARPSPGRRGQRPANH